MATRRSASAETAFTPAATFKTVEKEVLGYVVKNGAGEYLQEDWADTTWGEWRSACRFAGEQNAQSFASAVGGRVVRVVRRR